MNYLYGANWHPKLRKPIKELSEQAARRRFETGPQLCVAAGAELVEGVVPDFTLLLGAAGRAVEPSFYTASGSTEATYTFDTPEEDNPDGRLFLAQVTLWLYPEGDGLFSKSQALAHTTLQFRPHGWARRRFVKTGAPQAHISEYVDVDVSGHWEDAITFGDWDRFGARREPSVPDAEGDDAPGG